MVSLWPYTWHCIYSVSEASCQEIKHSQDLHKALAKIGNWEALCANLEVEEAILDRLRYEQLQGEQKKQRCLQAFYQQGTVCWETVIKVLIEDPFYNGKLAEWIAKKHNVEWTFDKPPGEKHHKKCKLFLPCLSVCLSVRLSPGLSIYQSVCQFTHLAIYFMIEWVHIRHRIPKNRHCSLSFTVASSTKNTPEDQPMSQGIITWTSSGMAIFLPNYNFNHSPQQVVPQLLTKMCWSLEPL